MKINLDKLSGDDVVLFENLYRTKKPIQKTINIGVVTCATGHNLDKKSPLYALITGLIFCDNWLKT